VITAPLCLALPVTPRGFPGAANTPGAPRGSGLRSCRWTSCFQLWFQPSWGDWDIPKGSHGKSKPWEANQRLSFQAPPTPSLYKGQVIPSNLLWREKLMGLTPSPSSVVPSTQHGCPAPALREPDSASKHCLMSN